MVRQAMTSTIPWWVAVAFAVATGGISVPTAFAWDPLQKAERAAQEAGRQLANGEAEAAVESYLRAQALDPEDSMIRMGLGEALYAQGDLESAVAQFLAAADPDRPELARQGLYNAGNAMLAAGDPQKALQLYEQALLLGEPGEDLRFNLELAQRLLENAESENQPDPNQQDQQDQEQQEQQQQQEQEQQQQGDEGEQQEPEEQDQPPPPEEEQAPPDSTQVPPPPPDSTSVAPPESLAAMPQHMTPEEAMRLLEALDHDEEELRRSIQRRLRTTETESENDW